MIAVPLALLVVIVLVVLLAEELPRPGLLTVVAVLLILWAAGLLTRR